MSKDRGLASTFRANVLDARTASKDADASEVNLLRKELMNSALRGGLDRLHEMLKEFLRENPKWFYGTYYQHGGRSPHVVLWYIDYEWSRRESGEWIPPHLSISFWKDAGSPLSDGKPLTDDELDIPGAFIADFLDGTNLGCRTEHRHPWAVTYLLYSKDSKPRPKKNKQAKKKR